jgi:DNA-binding transcriptional LysR family regulator
MELRHLRCSMAVAEELHFARSGTATHRAITAVALSDRRAPFPGFHLYYPSRRQHSQAFALVVKALRYRG